MENLGYSFGMLANITDMMSFLSGGGQNITANSAKIKKDDWWGHHSLTDKNGNSLVSVGPDSGVYYSTFSRAVPTCQSNIINSFCLYCIF